MNNDTELVAQVEMQPLNEMNHSRRHAKKLTWIHSRWTSLIVFMLFCLGISLMFLKLDSVQHVMRDGYSAKSKDHLSVTKKLEARLAIGREKLHALLQRDYGEYAKVFDRDVIMNTFHPPSERSSIRLKRKLKIKVLKALLSPSNTTVDFIWATAGHSSAAGHGNLFNQSYSASIETAARTVFQELGIQFYGKNYAMGGTASAPEIALCLPEIVGPDIDVLSWDFGMTDGGGSPLYALFAQRAAGMMNRPVIFDFEGFDPHTEYNKNLDSIWAMSVFTISFIGLSMFPSSDDENVNVDMLPPGVKYFLCGGHPESGGDDCWNHRWDTAGACSTYGGVRFQVDWHGGWKSHLFIGRSIAAFLVENLSDAIDELSDPPMIIGEPKPSVSQEYLNYLLQLESDDRRTFFESPVPEGPVDVGGFDIIGTGNFSLYQRSNTVACHTARIPADSRNRGLVLESHVTSDYLYGGKTTYNSTSEGYTQGQQPAPQPEKELEPYLTYDYRAACPFADIDAKDMFTVRDTDGWMKTTVPNQSEKAFYSKGKDMNNRYGFVLICEKVFDWNDVPSYVASVGNIGNATVLGDVSLTINGVNVTGTVPIPYCHQMMHEGGFMFPKSTNPALDGQYEIRFRVHKPDGQLLISTIIVV